MIYCLFLFFLQVGVLPVDESKVTMKGRLGPGMMITVDLIGGQVCMTTFIVFLVNIFVLGTVFLNNYLFI